jgi:hypothetical protein
MLRKCVMLICVLVLGSSAASNAHPRDSRSAVYIDGLPCSSFCLSYLAWSRGILSTPMRRRPFAMVLRRTGIRGEGLKAAARARVAKARSVAPNSNQVPRAKVEALPPGYAAAKPAAPNSNQVLQAKIADLQPAADAAADSDKTATSIGDPHPRAISAAGSNARTIKQQVTAAMQGTATVVPAAEGKANNTDGSDHPEAVLPADAHEAATASPNDTELRIVLVMARPEIRSVSDLARKTIAIDDAQSASNGNVRAAIVAAGAAEVQLSGGKTKALDRLIGGAVPAAVLALVSPEAALRFPDIEGFKIFQVLLLPRSLKAAADTPQTK